MAARIYHAFLTSYVGEAISGQSFHRHHVVTVQASALSYSTTQAEADEAMATLAEYYKDHSAHLWQVLRRLADSSQHRVTFVGNYGEF